MDTHRISYGGLFFVLFFIGASLFFVGCSEPMRTLMAVDAEQKAQRKMVNHQGVCFDALLKEVREKRIKIGTRQEDIVARFGEPVVKKEKEFLYRNSVAFFDAPKVYMIFDDKGLLHDIRIEERND
jgi:hypothetical protein